MFRLPTLRIAARGVRRAPARALHVSACVRSFSSIDPADIAHFSRLAEHWWDEDGEFKPLHKMNRVRIQFMREKLDEMRGWDAAMRDVLGEALGEVGRALSVEEGLQVGAGLGAGAVLGAGCRLGILGGLGAVLPGRSRFHTVSHFSSSP